MFVTPGTHLPVVPIGTHQGEPITAMAKVRHLV